MQRPPIFLFISGKDGLYLSLFLTSAALGWRKTSTINYLFAFEWCVHKQQLAQYVLMFNVLPLQLIIIIIIIISCLS